MLNEHNSSTTIEKAILCYPCALRMSMLFRLPSPLNCKQLEKREDEQTLQCAKNANEKCTPLFDNEYNSLFWIVHETVDSIKRLPIESKMFELTEQETHINHDANITAQSDNCSNNNNNNNNNDSSCPNVKVKWLCVACYGLYQFLDLFHAPHNAAQIRCTQYSDSRGISLNINVNRSLTFTWLAAAVYFYSGRKIYEEIQLQESDNNEELSNDEQEQTELAQSTECTLHKIHHMSCLLPDATAIVPEELSNFKELYMCDLRARMLNYLIVSHDKLTELYSASYHESNSTHGDVISNAAVAQLPGLSTYMKCVEHYFTKNANYFINNQVMQIKGIDISAPEKNTPNTTSDLNQCRFAPQAFTYSVDKTSLVVEVVCRHMATEGLVTSEGVLPRSAISNRSESVLTYGFIYAHVLPYLRSIHYMPVNLANHTPSELTEQHKEDGRKTICGNSMIITNAAITPATVISVVTHANIFLIGNYRKMNRQLSQSPWFTNGMRVGTFSLQEIIANPLLRFFFPEGVTPLLPAEALMVDSEKQKKSQLSISRVIEQNRIIKFDKGNKECSKHKVKYSKRGRTTSNDDAQEEEISMTYDVHPSLVSAQYVYGFGRYKFHSAGREDVDVRMLGAGRPFVLELVNPSRESFSQCDLSLLTQEINESEGGAVEVSQLRATDAEVTVRLARHSESKIKRYRCVIWCSRSLITNGKSINEANTENTERTETHKQSKITLHREIAPLEKQNQMTRLQQCVIDEVHQVNAIKDLMIEQTTPLRVLHRRALCVRPRTIHSMHLQVLNAHWALLDLTTQAGTYVKEFVHGDMGRTLPNLASLLHGRTDIIQLDVLGMEMHDLDKPTLEQPPPQEQEQS